MNKKPPKILIVDDEQINIDVLVDLLASDYKIIVARSGEQALKRLESPELPDLIVLDIMMPQMNGYEICKIIKENRRTQNIPVIFLTVLSDVDEEKRGFDVGAVDFITKPFSPPIVKARVHTHVTLKQNREQWEELAREDVLTGISNRRCFNEVLLIEWNRAKRSKSSLSLLLIDVDFFKLYNDNYGHAKGDECLRRVADTLKSEMKRSSDLLARFGGEEFACILPETDKEGALAVAENLLDVLRMEDIAHEYSKISNRLTLSIGVASVIPTHDDRHESLIETADKALYLAKDRGRNRIEFL